MSDIDISQAEADALIKMEKQTVDESFADFPMPGEKISIALQSIDKRESFLLDINRGKIRLSKVTYQNRARQAIILLRLDLGAGPHRNPDGEEISGPHIHTYREGYADKWAEPAPKNVFSDLTDIQSCLDDFMDYCNITKVPRIQKGLFS